ncbi:cupin [Marinithermofilum abyssi]|jgi:quercetin dioxygenase-like cupin family protein|uniref:Cupin n=1 Tax=Marinithermofilum abyssi TaxID=1571185 RepID=A0A8J2VCG4_9BACL|nr:cupin [Marinithermofilum abyssi]GGE06666.1 cupin [Marinithermofilum abyssi]
MNIYRFDREVGTPVEQFGNTGVTLSRILLTAGPAQVSCIHLDPEGRIGEHRGTAPELFLIVEGEGWVSGSGQEQIPVRAGEAVFWERGEQRSSGTRKGMTAMVIVGDSVEPRRFLTECRRVPLTV